MDKPILIVWCPTVQPCWCRLTQGLTDKEHKEEYLNSFHTKMVTLKDSKKLECQVAIDQLRAGLISMQDIIDEDGCNECMYRFPSVVSPLNICTGSAFQLHRSKCKPWPFTHGKPWQSTRSQQYLCFKVTTYCPSEHLHRSKHKSWPFQHVNSQQWRWTIGWQCHKACWLWGQSSLWDRKQRLVPPLLYCIQLII